MGAERVVEMAAALLVYATPLIAIVFAYCRRLQRRVDQNRSVRDEMVAAGLTSPPSLHPVIDPAQCIGCEACVVACPEGDVLGLVGDRAELVNPAACIGHGACKDACPADAISLVFGTAERGVDIPCVSPTFESNVAGIYIAGELGGMGLIRNAIEQGRQAMEVIAQRPRPLRRGADDSDWLDVVIVGAGPAGLSASLAAMKHGLRFVTLEQETLGGTVAHFPRGKLVMTAPAELPLVGKVRFRETTKEELLSFWEDVVVRTGLTINYGERVEGVERIEDGFVVRSTRGIHRTRSLLLAIGRRGTPRKLDVEGEERDTVVYRLVDAAQYAGREVLVVGGGDSALEAALALAEQPATRVTLSYRGEAFSRAKPANRSRIEEAVAAGRVTSLLQSVVTGIGPRTARVEHRGATIEVGAEAVVVCAGGVLPTAFLQSIGIETETKYGTA